MVCGRRLGWRRGGRLRLDGFFDGGDEAFGAELVAVTERLGFRFDFGDSGSFFVGFEHDLDGQCSGMAKDLDQREYDVVHGVIVVVVDDDLAHVFEGGVLSGVSQGDGYCMGVGHDRGQGRNFALRSLAGM